MELPLKGKKLTTVGDSVGFTVDAAYVKNGLLKRDVLYDIIIKEAKE